MAAPGHPPVSRTPSRRELLQISATSGDWEMVLQLIRHKPDKSLGKEGEMLLHEAVKQSQLFHIDLLLGKGVDPLATDSAGRSILHVAAQSHEHVVQHLLQSVPDIKQNINQVCSENGLTAYQIADMNNNSNTMALLEKNGAEPIPSAQQVDLELDENADPGKGYRDWPEIVLTAQCHLEDSCHDLKQQVAGVSVAMDQAFRKMEGMMQQLLDTQQSSRDSCEGKIQRLQQQLHEVQDDVNTKTGKLNDGVTTIIQNTDDLRASFKQAGEFNDYVYFRIFNRISQKVGLEKQGWRELCKALMENYPQVLLSEIQEEVESHHTKEEDMAYECFTKWHVYNSQQPNKIDALKSALHNSPFEPHVKDIELVLEEYQTHIPTKATEALSDALLLDLAENIGLDEYMKLGVYLGFSRPRLTNMDQDNRGSATNRNFSMLTIWRDSQALMNHTIQAKLVEALKAAGRQDLVAKLGQGGANGTRHSNEMGNDMWANRQDMNGRAAIGVTNGVGGNLQRTTNGVGHGQRSTNNSERTANNRQRRANVSDTSSGRHNLAGK